MRPVRVCLLTGSFQPMIGGGERYAVNLSSALARLGVPTCVVTRRISRALPRFEGIDGVSVHRVGPSGLARFGKYAMLPAVALRLIRLRRSYDLLVISNFRALGPLAVVMAKLLGKRCVLRAGVLGEFSGDYVATDGAVSPRALSWLAGPLALRRAVLRGADAFISNCEAIREEFRRGGVPDDRVALLPGGVDTGVFRPADAKQRRRQRAALGLPADASLIGYSGKLNRGKGLPLLVDAFAALRARHERLHLVLIGSGAHQYLSEETALRERVRALGLEAHVTFTGAIQDVAAHLQALDVFVLPTEHEALPNALMEAMACALPCVASRVGGIPDLIEDGVTGLLIAPRDAAALAGAMDRLLSDRALASRLGMAARERIERRYALDALARRHLELFAQLCNGVPAPMSAASARRSLHKAWTMAADLATGAYPRFVYGGGLSGLPVFAAHGVEEKPFEEQLRFLRDNGYRTVTADEYHALITGAERPSGREVMLTYDDGWDSLWSVGLPLLRRFGATIVVFLAAGRIGGRPFLTWDEVRAMHASGLVDFQSHSLRHRQVFCSSRIVGFVDPALASRMSRLQIPEWTSDEDNHPRFGRPLYACAPRMQARRRYLEDPTVRRVCEAYVHDHGGDAFFERALWRGTLRDVAKRAGGGRDAGRYETDEECRHELWEELDGSKRRIEEELPGKVVRHFAFPWSRHSELAVELSRRAGYVMSFSGKVGGRYGGARSGGGRNGGALLIPRLGMDFLFMLPGEGHGSLARTLWAKLGRNVNGAFGEAGGR